MMKQLNMDICSICKQEFKTLEKYLNHTCTTGFQPNQIEHQIELDSNYKNISDLALKRGKENK